MQSSNTQYYINRIYLVIHYPEKFIPTLPAHAIRSILIECLTSYFEGELSLFTLLTISENLSTFKRKENVSNQGSILIEVLSAINNLSQYGDANDIHTLLTKQLDKLLQE
jgi:hypothetical protein